MKQAMTFLLVVPFLLFFMFQPFFTEIVNLRSIVLENLTDKYTKLSAREGYFTPALQAALLQEIAEKPFVTSPSKVKIVATTSPVERGGDIFVTISAPIGNAFIFTNWFGEDGDLGDYRYTGIEMSELIL